jgi:hypothetical protein
MKTIAILAALAGVLVVALPAHAQATRTWVSGVGDDVNPCSRTAPCKTFAGAISKTATNGEINCLDPAGYGAVNITKGLTIDCRYTHGSILSANVNGIIINAGTAAVTIRGISINGASTTTGNGIRILAAGAVLIEDCYIANFAGTASNGRGITIETGAATRVSIHRTTLNNNNNIGVHSNPTAGSVSLNMEDVSIYRGAAGSAVQIRQLTSAMINRLTAAEHPIGAGVTLELDTATATINNSHLVNNAFGILVGNGGSPIARVGGSMISGNTNIALRIISGQIISSGNNIIRGNVGNEAPSSNAGLQ